MGGKKIMKNFIKYEIKGTYKNILAILALVIILTTALHIYSSMGMVSTFGEVFMVLSILILFGTAIATFFYIVGFFNKELYENRGYLTFALPLTGNQIVASKLIVALIWFILLGFVILVYNFLMLVIFAQLKMNVFELFSLVSKFIPLRSIVFILSYFLFTSILILLTIYFSMALGRVTFKDKKIGGLWFFLLIIINVSFSLAQLKIVKWFPYSIKLDMFAFNMDGMMVHNLAVSVGTGDILINIANVLFSFLVAIGLFLGTGYFLEKKIDL